MDTDASGGRTRERLTLILAACCTKIKCSGRLRAEKQTRDSEPTGARNPELPSLEKQKKILVFVYLFFGFFWCVFCVLVDEPTLCTDGNKGPKLNEVLKTRATREGLKQRLF